MSHNLNQIESMLNTLANKLQIAQQRHDFLTSLSSRRDPLVADGLKVAVSQLEDMATLTDSLREQLAELREVGQRDGDAEENWWRNGCRPYGEAG